jgi:RimJ/RimL family protein N-acetyltransferase
VDEQSKRKLENDAFTWMIEDKNGEPVGSIQTHTCNPRYGTFCYGIDIDAGYRHQGYASEAILAVVKYYFEELRYQKVSAWVYSDNEVSIKLHEKLGFQKEGQHRRMFFSAGKYVDEIWFGMTVDEFHQLHR